MTTILRDLFSIVRWWGVFSHDGVLYSLYNWLADIDNMNYQELQSENIITLDPQLNDWTNFTKFWLKVFFAVWRILTSMFKTFRLLELTQRC